MTSIPLSCIHLNMMRGVSSMVCLSGILLVIVMMMTVPPTHAVRFLVKPLETKCLGEDVQANELMVGKFQVEPKSPDIQIKVYSPTAEIIHSRTGADTGKFAVTTTTAGDHQICFTNTGSVDRDVGFSLEVGLTAKDYQAVAKKDNLKPLELELRRIEDVVQSIHESMEYLKNREEAMRNTNESTNSRVLLFSILSVLVLVGLGLWQVFYLREFFASKKMI